MRILILAAALALSACANSAAVANWRKTAEANCEKEADAIQRQTCRERVAAVTTTQTRQDNAEKRGR